MRKVVLPLLVILAVADGSARAAVSLTGDTMICVTADKRESGRNFAVKWVHAFVCTNALEAAELGASEVLGGVLDKQGHVRCTIRGVMDLPSACVAANVCGRSRFACPQRATGKLKLDAEEMLRHLLRAD